MKTKTITAEEFIDSSDDYFEQVTDTDIIIVAETGEKVVLVSIDRYNQLISCSIV